MESKRLELLKQMADGVAAQFGSKCEVVIHDVSSMDHSIVYIVNGHVSGRKVGDGGSRVVIEQALRADAQPRDELCYLTRTPDGKVMKSSSIYIRNSKGVVTEIFSINYDITELLMLQRGIDEVLATHDSRQSEPERIINVNDVLDDLIEQSVAQVGKPVAMMNKDDKIRAIQFLNQSGAFLVTKSGDKVAKYFGISKYTLYSYIDANKKQEEKKQ
ncbi:MAG: transcriptional regulator [Ruminococcaceae bacterium]|jgi:predicted transcriptional regulator YheO|nr:transcriptional regulator [Oscillospiraceae bacterium]